MGRWGSWVRIPPLRPSHLIEIRLVLRRGPEQALHDDAIPPDAGELGMAAIDTDPAESQAVMEGQAGVVFRKDPGDELPESQLFIGLDQGFQGRSAGPCPALAGLDIDGMFGDSCVAWTDSVWPGAGEGDHTAGTLDDEGRKAGILFAQLASKRLGLEGRDALGDALIVDGRDGRRVVLARQPDRDRGLSRRCRANDGRRERARWPSACRRASQA